MGKKTFKRAVSLVIALMMILSGIQMSFAVVPPKEDIQLTKTATRVEGKENTYEIQLSVLGEYIDTGKKADVILVIDNSNSMHDTKAGTKTLAQITKDAADAFINGVLTPENNDNVRVSIVQYGTDARAYRFSGEDDWTSNWSSGLNVNGDEVFTTDNANAKTAVNSATTKYINSNHGGTNTEGGFLMAKKIAEKTRPGAESIVIFMTDGVPTFRYDGNNSVSDGWSYGLFNWFYNSGGSSTSKEELNEAIQAAQSLANKSKIYTVGLFSEFDSTSNEAKLAAYLLSKNPSPKLYTSSSNTKNIINHVNNTNRWDPTGSYAQTYYPIFSGGDVANRMEEIYTTLAGTITALATGTVTDVIPEHFVLSEESIAALSEAGAEVGLNGEGLVTITYENVPADGTLRELQKYTVVAKPGYYGTGFTNESAVYDYTLNTEGGGTGSLEFPQPVVKLNSSAYDDSYSTTKGVTLTITPEDGILKNDGTIKLADDSYTITNLKVDSNYVGDTININGGSVVIAEDGSFTFTPDADFTGETEFEYKNFVNIYKEGGALNGKYLSNLATVKINVLSSEPTKIPVFKEWKDGQPALQRLASTLSIPDSLTVYLVKDNVKIATTTLYADNGWEGYFTVASEDSNNNPIDYYDGSYTVEEEPLEDYIPHVAMWKNEGFGITNIGLLTVPVNKTWEGAVGGEVIIQLLDDQNDPTNYTLTLNEENEWSDSFKLPKWVYDDADYGYFSYVDYSDYTIAEVEIDGYTTEIEGSIFTGFEVINTVEMEVIEADKYIINWNYENGYRTKDYELEETAELDDSDPDVVKNTEGGINLGHYITLGAKDGYTYSDYDFETFVTTGSAVSGTAIEVFNVAKIDLFYNMNNIDRDILVTKVWSGGSSSRPTITINLLADGKEVKEVVLTSGNTTHTFTVPKYNSETGNEITYTITEDSVSNYTSSISGFTVTNTYESGGGGSPGGPGGGGGTPPTIIEDPEIPLAELEKTDHFAYVIGYPEGDVRPLNNITREEVAMIFYRLLTDESRDALLTDVNPFTDVESGRWSNRAISTLFNADIISGYPDGTFRPSAPITRAEFATIAAKFDDLDLGSASKFTDIVGHWAEDYITSSENKGWIKGYPDMTFKPQQDITRAEAMTLINNVLERAVPAENIHPDAIFWPDISEDDWYYEAVMEATNSHDYTIEEDGSELWTGMKANKVWP